MTRILPPAQPTPCPITKARTNAGKAVVKAHAEWAEAFEAAEALEAQHAAVWAAHDEAETVLAEAMRAADADGVAAATAAVDDARTERDRPWHKAAAAASAESHAKAAAYRAAVDDGFVELLTETEIGPAATAVRDRILASIADLRASFAEFHEVRRRHEALAAEASAVEPRQVHGLGNLSDLRAAVERIDLDFVEPPCFYPGVAHAHEVLKNTGQVWQPTAVTL